MKRINVTLEQFKEGLKRRKEVLRRHHLIDDPLPTGTYKKSRPKDPDSGKVIDIDILFED